jgi:cephalosporin hydroxylase
MKIIINTDTQTVEVQENGKAKWDSLYSDSAYELLSNLTLKVGWNQKVPYTYSWMGFPILQIPDDMIRMQEVITRLKPDMIVETGVAHGGSLIFYATLCKAMGVGHVIGVEKGLRCRAAIEAHPLSEHITLIEGDSVSPEIVGQVHRLCARTDRVLVILDSCHSYQHVINELMAYQDLIRPGFYIVATDGNMQDLWDTPRAISEFQQKSGEIENGQEIMQMREKEENWAKKLPGLPQRFYAELAKIPQSDIGPKEEKQLQELCECVLKTGLSAKAAVQSVWGSECANASRRLRQAIGSGLAVPGLSSSDTSEVCDWEWNNPQHAAKEFAKIHSEFIIEQPVWPFNESTLTQNTTYWPNAWLKRKFNQEQEP